MKSEHKTQHVILLNFIITYPVSLASAKLIQVCRNCRSGSCCWTHQKNKNECQLKTMYLVVDLQDYCGVGERICCWVVFFFSGFQWKSNTWLKLDLKLIRRWLLTLCLMPLLFSFFFVIKLEQCFWKKCTCLLTWYCYEFCFELLDVLGGTLVVYWSRDLIIRTDLQLQTSNNFGLS